MNLLDTTTGRRVLFAALYVSEGAPIGYIWWALPTKLSAAGLPVEQVTQLTALLVLPWALKFLWAPVIDSFRGPRWGRRAWIVTTQLGMGLAIIPLVGRPFAEHLGVVTALLFVHTFLAATQDAAVDALCIASVPEHEHGSMNGWMQVGMLTSRAVFGGLALRIEATWGSSIVLIALVACVWFSMLLVLFGVREQAHAAARGEIRAIVRFARTLYRAVGSRVTRWGLLFAAIGGAAFEATGAVAGPLLVDAGAAQERVGDFFALPVIVSMGLGALAGGRLSDRLGRTRCVAVALVLLATWVTIIACVRVLSDESTTLLFLLLSVFYGLIGVFTASSYAMFMDLTNPQWGATQFSALMGATNACEAWAGFAVGRLAGRWDYTPALLAMAVLSLLALPVLYRLHALPSIIPADDRPSAQRRVQRH